MSDRGGAPSTKSPPEIFPERRAAKAGSLNSLVHLLDRVGSSKAPNDKGRDNSTSVLRPLLRSTVEAIRNSSYRIR